MLKTIAAMISAVVIPGKSRADQSVRHILPVVSDTCISLTVSLWRPRQTINLMIDDHAIAGKMTDTEGLHWTFLAEGLLPDTRYQLSLHDDNGMIGDGWPLSTFPDHAALPDSFRLLAFTCAGGGDGLSLGPKQIFKPLGFRQRLFNAALEQKPDAAIAIGDHVYFDLKRGNFPSLLRRAGLKAKNLPDEFDRSLPVLGTSNEKVLKQIGNEQIADLYGTRFKSTPVYFVADDHDYFENDDAESDLVTFPPDQFSRDAQAAIARLYYPPMPDAPIEGLGRSFGTLRYGNLFEAPVFDCAGYLTLGGDSAVLLPGEIEAWLVSRAKQSPAEHFAFVPSHPFGWTAGKWREWYPDVVAPDGFKGVVMNEVLGNTRGKLTTEAQKYLWQSGWWKQHQRLLKALAKRPGHRFTLSGDIHAQGVSELRESGDLHLTDGPVVSVLVGPVSTSDITWPSAARGIPAGSPGWVKTKERAPTHEVNGFTIFEFSTDAVTARLFDCGGFDRSKGEDGTPVRVTEVDIA